MNRTSQLIHLTIITSLLLSCNSNKQENADSKSVLLTNNQIETDTSLNIDPSNDKFLIVLDIQKFYTIGKLPESSAQKLMDSVNYVINHFNPKNVIYIKSLHRLLNLSLSRPFIYVSFDTAAMRFDERLIMVNKQIFTKDSANAFTINDLNNFLKQNNAKEIVIIGLMAEECIYESLLGGKDSGYNMYMIPEAIIGKSEKSKDKMIKKIRDSGIKILNINTSKNQRIEN